MSQVIEGFVKDQNIRTAMLKKVNLINGHYHDWKPSIDLAEIAFKKIHRNDVHHNPVSQQSRSRIKPKYIDTFTYMYANI